MVMSLQRMSLFALSVFLCAALALCSVDAYAADPQWRVADGFSTDWQGLKIDVRELAPHVHLLHGSGGNTLASLGPDGTLLVDTEFPQVAPKLKASLQQLKAGPVRYVISTHYHSDHTGGNGAFQQDGAVIVGQENCRLRMTQTLYSAFWKRSSPPAPAANVPTLTFDRRLTLLFNGEEVEAFHNQPAHTDGDTVVYFRHANVVHLGDIFVNNLYPYIDLTTQGRIDGYFPVIDEVLAMIDDHTQVVPGHGPMANKQELKAYRDMLQTVRDRVAAQIAQGASLDQILASHPSHEFDKQYATDRVGPEGFVTMVYQSLTAKH
jgi:cyclase